MALVWFFSLLVIVREVVSLKTLAFFNGARAKTQAERLAQKSDELMESLVKEAELDRAFNLEKLLAAEEACKSIELLDDWSGGDFSLGRSCIKGVSYHCSATNVSTSGKCMGLFSVNRTPTVCGVAGPQTCASGTLPAPQQSCGLMLLTTYFTTKKDWQRGIYTFVTYTKLRRLYRSSVRQGLNVTVLYDRLPQYFINRYANDRFRFQKVNLSAFDSRYGVNDVRYFSYRDLIKQHPEWKNIFLVDAFDVQVGSNPCAQLEDNRLYVGQEHDTLKKHKWMVDRFKLLGGKYWKWIRRVPKGARILNCGITGGRRDVVMNFVQRMTEVLADPDLAIRKSRKEIDLNMQALNYLVYNEFPGFVTGKPVHSDFKGFQVRRKDVWFIHK